ncbi:MAG TPA: hypothetical protein VN282_14615 [Pyrinomonadaceae bacterium]|nr:hypothetical protein [Pyrinomonadaceae bacterium]
MRSKPSEITRGRRGERGAALVMSLLVAMLLLAAGGALIATAGMTVSNAADATAEAQAYYAADAGLQAALTVIRRNREGEDGLEANFHNIACGTDAECDNVGNDLSEWLTYDEDTGRINLSDSGDLSYALTVTDPSKPTDPADADATIGAAYSPRYLLVRSTGYGPRGAVKQMEMMVDRFKFEYDAPASLVLRESEAGGTAHLTIDPGSGGPTYSGQDKNSAVLKGAVGVGNTTYNSTTDYAIALSAMSGIPPSEQPGGVIRMGSGAGEQPWPAVVADAQSARDFVDFAEEEAQRAEDEGRGYHGGCPANNFALNGLIFINADCSLGPNNSGKGFMVVTGDLTLSGSYNFEGLIFALGDGNITRNGGGGSSNGTIYGGILAARFGANGGFQALTFNSNGGGGSIVQYDSVAVENALALFGPRTIGIVEK